MGDNLQELGSGKEFLKIIKYLSIKIDKLNFFKLRTFSSVMYPVKRVKIQTADWEKILLNHSSKNELTSRIYIEYT